MTHRDQKPPAGRPNKPVGAARKGAKPGWADGLRKLYDDVVAEPLPDSFEDLLNRLDQADND